jgi:signal transduction histidine kinase
LGISDSEVLASAYLRPLMLLVTMIVLMRRLAFSLNSLDAANETLRRRLSEQEAELSRFHREERGHVASAVREQERQRLTRDLHDGLSGHLVSIMALAERDAGPRGIEAAAREALEDLRLVINALDIGDQDLPLALAGLRERLEPRLRRLGVAFAWSMDGLPDISGVTPSSALIVLRILQEAVTNAHKHGPAQRIAVRGGARDGHALIVVENDGAPGAGERTAGSGHGLGNMRRRAEQLGGSLELSRTGEGARLELVLPLALPEIA